MAATATPVSPQSGDDLGFTPAVQQRPSQQQGSSQDDDLGFTPVSSPVAADKTTPDFSSGRLSEHIEAPEAQPYAMPDGRLIDPATHTGGIPNPHAISPTQAPPPLGSQTGATLSAGVPPTLMQRMSRYIGDSTLGKNLHVLGQEAYGALGGSSSEGDTESDKYLQETQAAASPYKPIAAVKQIGAGLEDVAAGAGYGGKSPMQLLRENPSMTPEQAVQEAARQRSAGADLDRTAKGATDIMRGGMELSKPLIAYGVAAAPLKAAIYYGAGILAGKGSAHVAQELGATPNEVEFFNTAGFFIPGTLTGLAGIRTAGIPEGTTTLDPVTGEAVPVRGGVIGGNGFAAGAARSDTGGYAGQVRVGPYSAGVKFGRNAPEAPGGPEQPRIEPGAQGASPEAASQPPAPPVDASTIQRQAQTRTIDEVAARQQEQALQAKQIVGLAPPPPPPPKPGEPGSKQVPPPAGIEEGHISQQVLDDLGTAIQQLPAASKPKAVLEATGRLAKVMFESKTVIGPDNKVVNVDSQKLAQTEAVNLVNDQVEKKQQEADDAAKSQREAQDAQQKQIEKQQKDAEIAAQEREDARVAAEKNEVPPLPDTPPMRTVRAILDKLPAEAKKADVILAARKAAASVKLNLPYKLAERLADEHLATRAQQEDAAVHGITGEEINHDQHPVALAKLATDVKEGKTAFLHVQPQTKFKPSELTKESGFTATKVDKLDKTRPGGDGTFLGTYYHPKEIKSRDVKLAASGPAPLAALRQLEAAWKASQTAQEPENQGRAVLSESPEQVQLGNPPPETKPAEIEAPRPEVETKPAIAETEPAEPAPGTFEHARKAFEAELAERKSEGKTEKSEGNSTKTEAESVHKFGNTQADIDPASDAGKSLATLREKIGPADLAGDGLVKDSHITVRYGIKDEDFDGIRAYLEKHAPFEAKLGKTSSFPPSEHSDGAAPIIVLIESPDLRRMEAEIDQHGNFAERSFPEYKPHSTLAYVKPEAAKKYAGLTEAEGKTFTVKSVSISKRDGTIEEVQLKGATEKPAVVSKPQTFKPGQMVSVKNGDGTVREAQVRFMSPAGKVILKGERKPAAIGDVSPAVTTEAQAVAPDTAPPSELEAWKDELKSIEIKLNGRDVPGNRRQQLGSQASVLRGRIADAERAVKVSGIPLTKPEEKVVVTADQSKWKTQGEYFIKALESAKDAWLEAHPASNRDVEENWDFLKKNGTYNGGGSAKHRPERFPDDFIRIEVPNDGKFLVNNTPSAIDKLLKSAPRAFAKPSETVPGSSKSPSKPKGPADFDEAKQIKNLQRQIDEHETDLRKAERDPSLAGQAIYHREQLEAARAELAERQTPRETRSPDSTFYSNPLDPALFKRYIGEPLLKMAEPLRREIAEHGKIADVANNVHDTLQNLDRTNRATTLEAKALTRSMKEAGFSNEDGKAVFKNLEDPAVPLNEKQIELRDNWIRPMNQQTRLQFVVTKLIETGKFPLEDVLEGKVPQDEIDKVAPEEDGYQHRIAVEHDTFVDKLLGDSLKRFRAPGNVLSRMFPSAKRSILKEIHGPDGEREVVAVKNGRVTQFLNKDNAGVIDKLVADAQSKLDKAKQESPQDLQRHTELQGKLDDLKAKQAELAADGHTTVDLGSHLGGYVSTSQMADEAVAPLEAKLDKMKQEFTVLHGSQGRAIVSQQRIENLYYQIDAAEKQIAAVRASVGPEQEAQEGVTRAQALQERIKPLQDQIQRLTDKQASLAARDTNTKWGQRELKAIPGRIQDLKDRIDAVTEELAGKGLEGNYWRDKNGNVWKFNRGTTEFISDRTGQQYHADARLAGIVNYMETNKAMNAAVVLERAKGMLESEGMAIKAENSKDVPDGWKPTSLQQMRGYYFPEHVADAFDQFDYLQQRGAPNVLQMANNFVIQSVLMNPLYHGLNIGSNWFAGKEGELLAGKGISPRWYADQVKAGIEAANMMKDWGGPEYQRLLRLGLDLRGADTGFDTQTKAILRSFTDQLDADKPSNVALSALLGVKNAAHFMQKMNHQITFGMGDLALAQAFYAKRAELIRNGVPNAEEAARDWAHRMVGEYTTPIRLAGSAGLGRLAENPLAQSFFRYHFGYILRPLTQAVREAVGGEFKPDEETTDQAGKTANKFGQSPAQARILAIARLAALVAMATYVFPKVLDQIAKHLTSDERARAPRGGLLKFASDAYETATGERSIASLAGSVFTPGLGPMELVQLGANRDNFTGRHIYGSDQDPEGKAKQVGAWLIKGTLPGQTAARMDQSGLRQVVEGLLGFKFPIEHGIREAVEIRRDEGGSNPPDPARTRVFQSIMAAAAQSHKSQGQDTSLHDALLASGKLSKEERKTLSEAIHEAPIVFAVRGLEHPQDYYRVLQHSTDEEKSALLHDHQVVHKINLWQKELRSQGKTSEADKVLSEITRR